MSHSLASPRSLTLRSPLICLLAACTLFGCRTPASPGDPAAARSAVSPASSSGMLPSSAAPASAAAPPGSASPAARPALSPLQVSFHVAAEGTVVPRDPSGNGAGYGLHRLDGALLLQAAQRFALFDGDRLVEQAALTKAVGGGRTATVFFGRWPKATFAQLMNNAESNANYQQGALYRYRGAQFQLVKKTGTNTYYQGAYYPGDGRLGALLWSYLDGVAQTWIEILEGSPKGPLPTPATVDGGQARIGIHTMLALPTGHLFTYGPDNASRTHEPAIERWEPGQSQSVIERPPSPPGTQLESVSMVGRAANEVYLCGKLIDTSGQAPDSMYLARFDGKTWSRLETPTPGPDGGRPLCEATSDGTLWMFISGNERPALYRRALDGIWSTALLPQPQGDGAWSPTAKFLAYAPDDLWFLLETQADPARFVVFRTKPAGSVLRFSE